MPRYKVEFEYDTLMKCGTIEDSIRSIPRGAVTSLEVKEIEPVAITSSSEAPSEGGKVEKPRRTKKVSRK